MFSSLRRDIRVLGDEYGGEISDGSDLKDLPSQTSRE